MRQFVRFGAAVALGLTALGFAATTASAAIVCNRAGECWHARGRFVARPEFGVVVHPNNWRWGAREHFTWREHPGRGYWRNGVWIRL
jgi:hypothetical protein